jgi:hypothetical protein
LEPPPASAFTAALEGETQGIGWQVLVAQTESGACAQVLLQPGDEAAPLADYPETLDPTTAVCITDSLLNDERRGLIDLFQSYALPNETYGVWGIAADTITSLQVEVDGMTYDIEPANGLFFLEVGARASAFQFRAYSQDELLVDCRSDAGPQDLDSFCVPG